MHSWQYFPGQTVHRCPVHCLFLLSNPSSPAPAPASDLWDIVLPGGTCSWHNPLFWGEIDQLYVYFFPKTKSGTPQLLPNFICSDVSHIASCGLPLDQHSCFCLVFASSAWYPHLNQLMLLLHLNIDLEGATSRLSPLNCMTWEELCKQVCL